MNSPPDDRHEREPDSGQYLVVARRYRPRSFEELVGQGPVAHALANAITGHRVGHAYLFTGARGVGKTSAARIFAKALNCQKGPSPEPDNTCDVCLSVDAGEDIDVIEIDGASNRGIEEIRQLRSNIHIRPSRSPYKIYIIDEVHMLTTQAFNALLKTLEEPPEHVKFIFCTTDPEKIPITVLSRCQRYDFAPIDATEIVERLRYVLRCEGRHADDSALAILARRAAGSMRDSQSLLEQLLAFSGPTITAEDVYAMLGSADPSTLTGLVDRLIARDAAGAMEALERASRLGIDAGHLAEQLLTAFRDMLVASVGGDPSLALQCEAQSWPELAAQGRALGMETLLAISQILDHTLIRMRQSTHGRILLELALIRITALDRLDDLARLVDTLRQGAVPALPSRSESAAPIASARSSAPSTPPPSAPTSEKKKPEPSTGSDRAGSDLTATESAEAREPIHDGSGEPAAGILTAENANYFWTATVDRLSDLLSDAASRVDHVAIIAPNRLVAYFSAKYNLAKERCERAACKSEMETTLRQLVGVPVGIEFRTMADGGEVVVPKPTARQRLQQTERHALVARARDLFAAEIVRVDGPVRPEDGR
ncbi:MAG: DNA polymerase III subunit gamma/tau [Planctomycetes bacterium]|nr:DNA polymerase III subunit gamma/tau [Planctomycetota bacterium]